MNTNKDNFNLWFRDILKLLYDKENAGFPILMITFPLLERYLRSKSGLSYDDNLDPCFYDQLVKLFPELKDNKNATLFWNVYRNGILHQSTLSEKDRKGKTMPSGGLTSNIKESIEIDSNDDFSVNPVKFAKKVITTIDKDFSTFEALGVSTPKLATIQITSGGYNATCGSAQRMIPPVGFSGHDKAKP